MRFTVLLQYFYTVNKTEYMTEIWKDVRGYEGLYQVSDTEKIRSLDSIIICKNGVKKPKKGQLIKMRKDKDGYLILDLHKNGKAETVKAHRIVCFEFNQNPENKPEVNHKDGVRTNIKPDNLEWSTRSENNLHAFRVLKRKPVKANLGKTSYKNKKSKTIIQLTLADKYICEYGSAMEAMRQTGIAQGCISRVANGDQEQSGGFKWMYKTEYHGSK
jgi:hypothetical protein